MTKIIQQPLTVFLFLSLLALLSCSEPATNEPSAPPPPPEPVTARFAFQRMYIQARTWAPDVQPLRISNMNLNEVPSEAGKCAAWRATFVSNRLKRSRTYTFSVVESPGNAYEGVLPGPEQSWSGPTGQALPFPPQMLKVDSDEAYSTAVKRSSAFVKENPDKPVHFLLEFTPRFPNLTWRVIWGDTLGSSDHSIFVDSSTGKYLQTL
ncbi:MAG: hypothetical protein AB1898_13335 [Acidobacteriota bacterium]